MIAHSRACAALLCEPVHTAAESRMSHKTIVLIETITDLYSPAARWGAWAELSFNSFQSLCQEHSRRDRIEKASAPRSRFTIPSGPQLTKDDWPKR